MKWKIYYRSSRTDDDDERKSKLKDRVELNKGSKNKKKNLEKSEDNLRVLWDNIKDTNICIILVPKGEKKWGGGGGKKKRNNGWKIP